MAEDRSSKATPDAATAPVEPHHEHSIGTVARMTGLTTHTIRKWEERYGVIEPHRSAGGDRRYSDDQVARLSLIRALVDAGTPIRELADLDATALRELGARSLGQFGVEPALARVGVMGDTLPTLLEQNQPLMPKLRFEPLGDEAVIEGSLEALIVERPALGETSAAELEDLRARSGVRCLVVVYGYARQDVAVALSSASTACLRTPLNYRELQRTVLALIGDAERPLPLRTAPSRRYSKPVLARVAALPSTVVCECPRHIAELVFALGDFEAYSAECESRDDKDALIHAYLKQTAAHARAAFEEALATVARHENIPVDDWQAEG